MAKSKLQKFSELHPVADLAIVRNSAHDFLGSLLIESENPVDLVWNCRVIATYSRRRDAWRALRDSGYTQEGAFWRRVPAQALPPRFTEPMSEEA